MQPEASPLFKNMLQATLVVSAVMLVFVLMIVFVFRAMRSKPVAGVEKEFARSKDTLLLLAQQKKALREKDNAAQRNAEAEELERQALKESVDPGLVLDRPAHSAVWKWLTTRTW